MFELTIHHRSGTARAGELATPHGALATPAFMPCGTAGTVKGLTPDQLRGCGVQMLLGNTYHLMLRPGAAVVAALGGLHAFMAWDRPILTDSGGYQVFSLADIRKITDDGVVFQSHVDGSKHDLTPEACITIQTQLGSDVMMQLDECPPAGAERQVVAAAVRRSADWAGRCKAVWRQLAACGLDEAGLIAPDWPRQRPPQALFGIQQGGVHVDLRAESARRIVDLDLPGYAVGGLSVGEPHEMMVDVLEAIDGQFPLDKPRYLMGVGEPRDILAGVARGVDMFDCVLPTRNGRNAEAFTWHGRMKLRNAAHRSDPRPVEEGCPCYACQHFSRAAVRHYFMAQEMLGPILLTIHNLTFFQQLMAEIRRAIADGTLAAKSAAWLEQMYAKRGAIQVD